jgi:hypothetical protein
VFEKIIVFFFLKQYGTIWHKVFSNHIRQNISITLTSHVFYDENHLAFYLFIALIYKSKKLIGQLRGEIAPLRREREQDFLPTPTHGVPLIGTGTSSSGHSVSLSLRDTYVPFSRSAPV